MILLLTFLVIQSHAEVDKLVVSQPVAEFQEVFARCASQGHLAEIVAERRERSKVWHKNGFALVCKAWISAIGAESSLGNNIHRP
jgi:hypothetical protein